jgi:tetratricopeptide (TPR) repeat protein
MRNLYILGVLLISVWRVQAQPPTPAEIEAINAALLADLRGTQDAKEAAPVHPVGRAGSRPSPGPVSVAQLRHKPSKNTQKLMTRGARLSQAGNHRGATEEFEKAAAADPEFAGAYFSLGLEYARVERYGEAQAALQRSLTLDPSSGVGHYNLAVVFYRTGDLPAAEQSLRRAVELSKDNVQAHTLLGWLLWRRVETRSEALEHLKYAARSSLEAKQLLATLQETLR